MADAERDLQPTVEDCTDSSDSEGRVVMESFRRSPANVTAKRTFPSDLGKPGAAKAVNSDLQSDSGYSSHTAATMSSADSAPSARMKPVAPVAPTPPPNPATVRQRRPTMVAEDRRPSISQNSPRKPSHRSTGSTASKRGPGNRRPTITAADDFVDCDDPNCHDRRPQPSLDSALDVSYPFDVRSQRSDPAPSTYTSPPSPAYTRQPAPYAQGPVMIEPAQTRRRSSSAAPRRPMSYSGDPGQAYWGPAMPGGYPTPPQERGPPLAMPHYNMPHQQMQHPNMPPYMMQHNAAYYSQGQPQQTSPPYEHQRPPLSARTSSNATYQPRGSLSYGPPVVSQPDRSEGMPSARYSNVPQTPRHNRSLTQGQLMQRELAQRQLTQPQLTQGHEEYESSESGSSSEEEDDDDEEEEEEVRPNRHSRELMPPPKLQSVKQSALNQRRPSLHKAKTTQVVNELRRMSQSQHLPRDREARVSRLSSTTPHSRTASVSRPALIQHPPKTQSYEAPRSGKVIVENSHSRRRPSHQRPHEVEYEAVQKSRNRAPKVYHDDEYEVSQKSRRRASKVYQDDEYEVAPKPRNRDSKVYFDDEYEVAPRTRDSKTYYDDGYEVAQKPRNREPKIYHDDEYEVERKRNNRSSKVFRDAQPVVDQERQNRNSKVYYDDDEEDDQDAIIVPERPRQRSNTSSLKRPVVENQGRRTAMDDAEAYQQQMRGNNDPLNNIVHKAALKQQSRVPSDGASRRSDDRKSRASRAPTAVTNANNEIRFRVDASTPLSLSFNGDMEGRTLQFQPAGEGMADIVIGNSRDNENVYRNEKGSLLGGRKAIMGPDPRRDAEESSVRSARSSNGRRETDRRQAERPRNVLRRRTEFD